MGFKLISSGGLFGCWLVVLSVIPGALPSVRWLDSSREALLPKTIELMAQSTASIRQFSLPGVGLGLQVQQHHASSSSCFKTPSLNFVSFQEPAAQEPEAARPKPRRLPTYFSRVVTQKQREDIYAIQDKYEAELETIRQQLDAKMKERDAEIFAVLNPEQLAEVQRLTEEAKQRRSERSSGASATEETGGSEPAAGSGDGSGDGSGI